MLREESEGEETGVRRKTRVPSQCVMGVLVGHRDPIVETEIQELPQDKWVGTTVIGSAGQRE